MRDWVRLFSLDSLAQVQYILYIIDMVMSVKSMGILIIIFGIYTHTVDEMY